MRGSLDLGLLEDVLVFRHFAERHVAGLDCVETGGGQGLSEGAWGAGGAGVKHGEPAVKFLPGHLGAEREVGRAEFGKSPGKGLERRGVHVDGDALHEEVVALDLECEGAEFSKIGRERLRDHAGRIARDVVRDAVCAGVRQDKGKASDDRGRGQPLAFRILGIVGCSFGSHSQCIYYYTMFWRQVYTHGRLRRSTEPAVGEGTGRAAYSYSTVAGGFGV